MRPAYAVWSLIGVSARVPWLTLAGGRHPGQEQTRRRLCTAPARWAISARGRGMGGPMAELGVRRGEERLGHRVDVPNSPRVVPGWWNPRARPDASRVGRLRNTPRSLPWAGRCPGASGIPGVGLRRLGLPQRGVDHGAWWAGRRGESWAMVRARSARSVTAL